MGSVMMLSSVAAPWGFGTLASMQTLCRIAVVSISLLAVDTTSSMGRCSTRFGREGIQLNGKAVDLA
ncbi:hypothetical protein E2562_009612 [Oryza meyeriana var. granulata]|uniref:Uncharacterized protein n=1 Tax=Oryza meyeriana var. granulata TaxID=110450 RepID=A0A6G1BJ51_9ORYZ|nr:hypothetical protein E2562_009612 [Oryza meyeriana var. granulata]